MKHFALLILFVSVQAGANKLDLEMHNELIEKLSSVASAGGEDGDQMVDNSAVVLRLADLHSERSRMLSVANEGKGTQQFEKEITADRRAALQLYQRAYKKLSAADKARVDLQSAHLHMMLKEEKKGTEFFTKLSGTKGQASAVYRAQALIQLGDMTFAKGNFDDAKSFFDRALAIKENPRLNYTRSRAAWCLLNMGQTMLAERNLTALLTEMSKKPNEDSAFQEEISRDLATFMAKNEVGVAKIQKLKKLSPKNVEQSNLIHLATELDRVAKKKSALLVWSHVDKEAITFMDQVEKQVRIARIQYDLGNKPQLVIEIKRALILISDSKCQKESECEVERQNLRTILTDWGKAEERIPSKPLIQGFVEYLKYFEDYEMAYWAGQAAMKQKEYLNAFKMFKLASSYKTLHAKLQEKNPDPRDLRMFEGSLLSAIDAAELTKDKNVQLDAYTHYLKFNPEGTKAWEVRYQIAMVYYELNKFNESSPRFKEIALSPQAASELRNKSADLYFDALALQKNDQLIETEALAFATVFSNTGMAQKKEQFLSLWRKSILNQSASILKNQNSSESDLRSFYNKVGGIQLAGWPAGERKILSKNKLLLAYRVKDLVAVENSVVSYLAQKGLSADERNEAYLALAWSQEMRFQFSASLVTLKKVNTQKFSASKRVDHALKLALLSELSQKNPAPYYNQVLAQKSRGAQAQFAAHQLITTARNPVSLYTKHYSLLARNPALFASATIYVYEKFPKNNLVQKAMKRRSMQQTSEGSLISTAANLSELQKLRKGATTPLRGGDARVAGAIKARMRAISGFEKMVNTGIRQKNLTLQFIGLKELSEANAKLHADIQKLPIPRGVKVNEREIYRQQVAQQTASYLQQSAATKSKAIELWNAQMEGNFLKDLTDWSEQSRRPGSSLARKELATLKSMTQKLELSQRPFIKFSEERRQLSSSAVSLQGDLKQDPFNISYLQKLKQVQHELGSGPMVAYLNTRLDETKNLDKQQKGERN